MGIERNNIEEKYKWDLEKMYPDKDSVDADIKKAEELTEEIAQYKGKLALGKENLLNALKTLEEASRVIEKIYVYTHMKHHEDTRKNDNQADSVKSEMN